MTAKSPTTRKAPRACVVCGTRLSTYNEGDTCYAHTVELPWRGPNTKPR